VQYSEQGADVTDELLHTTLDEFKRSYGN